MVKIYEILLLKFEIKWWKTKYFNLSNKNILAYLLIAGSTNEKVNNWIIYKKEREKVGFNVIWKMFII